MLIVYLLFIYIVSNHCFTWIPLKTSGSLILILNFEVKISFLKEKVRNSLSFKVRSHWDLKVRDWWLRLENSDCPLGNWPNWLTGNRNFAVLSHAFSSLNVNAAWDSKRDRLLFDDNEVKMARKPGKKQKENPVACTGEDKRWKGNMRRAQRR